MNGIEDILLEYRMAIDTTNKLPVKYRSFIFQTVEYTLHNVSNMERFNHSLLAYEMGISRPTYYRWKGSIDENGKVKTGSIDELLKKIYK